MLALQFTKWIQTQKCAFVSMKCSSFNVLKSSPTQPFASFVWACNRRGIVQCIQSLSNVDTHSTISKRPWQHGPYITAISQYGTEQFKKNPVEVDIDKANKGATKSTPAVDPEGFKLVYSIHHLYWIRFVSLLKLYQTFFNVAVFPLVTYLWTKGTVTTAFFLQATGAMTFSLIMLCVIANFFTRVICRLYINTKADKVKISHLTFRTRRNDVIVDLQDISPVSDVSSTEELYYDLQTFDKKHRWKLFLKFGDAHDKTALAELIGKF